MRTLGLGFLFVGTYALSAHHAQAVDFQCGPEVIDEPLDLHDAVTEFVSGGTCTVISLDGDISLVSPVNLYVIDELDVIQPVRRSLTIEGNGFTLSGHGVQSGLSVYLLDTSGSSTLTVRDLGMNGFGDSGALSVISDATIIERSRFANNRFQSSGPLPNFLDPTAGAVNALGRLTIRDSEFAHNHGSNGGAIFNAARPIELDLTSAVSQPFVISGSTFTANEAGVAGGAISATQSLAMINSTLTGNSALSAGGVNVAGSVSLDFCTIIGNASTSNRAAVSASGNIGITKSIVYGNPFDPIGSTDTFADVAADGTVVITSSLLTSSDSITSTLHATVLDDSNIVGEDPLLSPLGDYGGFTLPGGTAIRTRPPQIGSPIIDKIEFIAVGSEGEPTDQRGTGFSRFINGRADIGAVEFWPVPDPTMDPSDPVPDFDDRRWSSSNNQQPHLPNTT